MFNIIEKNQKFVKGIMIAVIASFVLWGIGGYIEVSSDDGYIAKVGSQRIYTSDIDQAMQDNPQQNTDKMQVLFGLISRQLLMNNIDSYHMVATPAQLQEEIAQISLFQNKDGTFDLKKYEEFLRERVMSSHQFQTIVGQRIVINQILNFFKNSYFSSHVFEVKFTKLLSRQRNVSQYIITPQQFYNKVNVSESDIVQYYQQNIAKFTTPDKVKVQYVMLDPATVAAKIQVSDQELNKYINAHKGNMSNEQIDVSHILFTIPEGANAKTKSNIKAKAEKILAKIKTNPSKFPQFAKTYSQDPGSASKGGDLGYISKGIMVKNFEVAAYALKPGQISGIVETQFGYHILKLNSVKGGSIDDMRKVALSMLQKQKATVEVQKQLEQLNDLTYNHPSSLEVAAKKLGLTIQSSENWISKGDTMSKYANPKIQAAIFNTDVIEKRNNSEVVDLGDGSHVVYRVTDYQISKVQSLVEVKEQITTILKNQLATQLAVSYGQQQITLLQNKKVKLAFNNPEDITLLGQSQDIGQMAIKQIFGMAINKLPVYTGSIDSKGNFVIYQINHETIDPKLSMQNKQIISQLNQANSSLELNAYVSSLRTKYDVDYKVDRLHLQIQ